MIHLVNLGPRGANNMGEPLAYHLTWTTYGSWLHGDARGWIKSGKPGIQEGDAETRETARALMTDEPVRLSDAQRELVERVIREVIAFRGWELHAVGVRSNHVHVVVTANRPPETVMEQLKSWCSRRLSEQLGGKRKWWTEHGSTKWVNDKTYFLNAVLYVQDGQ